MPSTSFLPSLAHGYRRVHCLLRDSICGCDDPMFVFVQANVVGLLQLRRNGGGGDADEL